jgi:hypothetical protein
MVFASQLHKFVISATAGLVSSLSSPPASEFRNSETRLSPAQRDDGGQEESDEDKNNPDDPVHPV